MRICHVWDAEYPWDVRAFKVVKSLTEAGHEVHLVARNRDGRPLEEHLPECTVHRMAPLNAPAALNSASMFPAFFNPRWLNLIRGVARRTAADLIICRDLPLAPTSIRVGRSLGIPVMLDMAENYPAMMQAIWDTGKQRWPDWFVRNPRAVSKVERWVLRRIDHTLVVVEESRDRLVQLGVPLDRMTVVSNTPPLEHLAESATVRRLDPGEPLHVIYLGLLEAPRGIAVLIRAIGLCLARGLPVRLTLIGDGRDRADFEQLARTVDPDGTAISFLGYVANADALRHLRSADVGVIPHHVDESWSTTIPNKLFDYMAAGLAVLGSDAPPVKRVIEETGCGRAFRDRDEHDLAAKLSELHTYEARHAAATAGRTAISEQYNWSVDAGRMLQSIERVVGQAATSPGRRAPRATV